LHKLTIIISNKCLRGFPAMLITKKHFGKGIHDYAYIVLKNVEMHLILINSSLVNLCYSFVFYYS
jgi:hypothetical protein